GTPPPPFAGPAGTTPPSGRIPHIETPPYEGPAGAVTPSGRAPGARTPGADGPAPAPIPGGITPRAPGGATRGPVPRAGLPGNRARRATSDVFNWRAWWFFNQDRFLDPHSRPVIASGSADFFLGESDRASVSDVFRPSEDSIRSRVVPAL